ncbi:MAG: hypothetical protein EOO41_02040 [Methanobacteriota archaeon]|nr:MAG: hypothetical protein EOO41_02040 [Euryarchaeota archaeon]
MPSRPTAAVRTGGTLPASVAATGSGAAASRTPVTARTRAVVHSRTAGGSSGVMSPAGAATANMTSPAAPTRAPTATSAASASRVITSVAAPVRPAVSAHTPAPPARATSPRQLARPGAGSSPRAGAHLSTSTAYSDAMRASTLAAASLPAAASASSTEPTQRLTEKEIRGIVAASQEAMKALSAGSSLASNRSAHAASAPAPAHAHGSPSLQELLSSLLPSQPPTAAHSNSGSHLLQGVRPAK